MTDEELIEIVGRAIEAADSIDRNVLARAAIAAINLPALTAWRNAVIDELTSLHIYNVEHDADPRKAVRDIVKWNQRLALDPAVSAEARALMVRGGDMVKEAAAGTVCGLVAKHATDATIADVADQLGQVLRALSVPAIVEAGDGKK